MKWADVVSNIDLSDGERHTFSIDPASPIETRTGRSGDYWAVIVSEAGRVMELTMGKRLLGRIADLGLKKTTEITVRRLGEGFQTDYEVSVA